MITYEEKLREMALADERIIVMTAENRAAIRNLPEVLGDRFIDTGITEQTMIGAAAGLALRGRIPVTHALATFLTMRAFEFIRTDVGIAGLPVKLVGAFPGFLSEANGPTHQAIEDVGLMRGIPNMGIFCPADNDDMLIGLETVIRSAQPFYIRFNSLPAVFRHQDDFEPGRAEIVSPGSDISILSYGTLVGQAYKACSLLKSEGFSVMLVNLRTLKPIDEAVIIKAAQGGQLLVTLEDHFLTGGLFSIISEILVRNGLAVNCLPLALEDRWFKPVLLDDILDYEGFTAPQIASKIKQHWMLMQNEKCKAQNLNL